MTSYLFVYLSYYRVSEFDWEKYQLELHSFSYNTIQTVCRLVAKSRKSYGQCRGQFRPPYFSARINACSSCELWPHGDPFKASRQGFILDRVEVVSAWTRHECEYETETRTRICAQSMSVTKGNVSRMRISNLSMNRLWSLCSNPDRKSSTSAGDGGSNKRRRTGLKGFRTRLAPFLTGSLQTAGGISLVLFPGWGGGVLGLLSTLGATTSSISGCWISSISFCIRACSWERLLHDRKDKWGFRNLRE